MILYNVLFKKQVLEQQVLMSSCLLRIILRMYLVDFIMKVDIFLQEDIKEEKKRMQKEARIAKAAKKKEMTFARRNARSGRWRR